MSTMTAVTLPDHLFFCTRREVKTTEPSLSSVSATTCSIRSAWKYMAKVGMTPPKRVECWLEMLSLSTLPIWIRKGQAWDETVVWNRKWQIVNRFFIRNRSFRIRNTGSNYSAVDYCTLKVNDGGPGIITAGLNAQDEPSPQHPLLPPPCTPAQQSCAAKPR